MKYVKKILLLVFVLLVIITLVDFMRISSYRVYPLKPENEIVMLQDEIYHILVSGQKFTEWSQLDGTLEFIQNEYDVSDFKLVNLIRILYEYIDYIPASTRLKIENVLLGFRYWMDEPGENSMCYWSENHQILFSSAEYLVGQLYEDKIFYNSKLTGRQHREKAKQRILHWLEMRWLYGFTEYYSGTYYIEDVAALLNLIDHACDEDVVQKSKIILDLLFYDISAQSFRGKMVSVSGRAYENNRKGGIEESLGGILPFMLHREDTPVGMVYALSRTKNYTIPPIFSEIAGDTSHVVIRQSNGLDIQELKRENLFGSDEKSIMMQWGMEAFINKEIINNSLRYIKKNKMFSNAFLKDFRYLDFTLLSGFDLSGFLSGMVHPSRNGKAIQRANTYTYKTTDYSLYSVQNHHPGDYADQHHVAGINIGNYFSVFHTHPAKNPQDYAHSPNYWVGYGRLPHVAQEKNVSLAIYDLPSQKNVTETCMLHFTHAYFPRQKFDSVLVSQNYVFGKKDDTYCALIGSGRLEFGDNDDIIQYGKKSAWIIHGGSKKENGSFRQFVQTIKSNPFLFDEDNLSLAYFSDSTTYKLEFSGAFCINDQVVDTHYPRFDSPYVKSLRKPQTLEFSFNGKKLYLDFYNAKREVN